MFHMSRLSRPASYGEGCEDEGDARGEREREVGRNNEPEKAGDVNVLSYREWRVDPGPATLACYPYSLLHSVTQLGYKW